MSFHALESQRIVRHTGESIEWNYAVLIVSLGVGVVALHALNAVLIRQAWPYLAGLVAMLTVPFANFLRLLRGVLRFSGAV
jgi:hypothetical protein